MTDAQTPFDIQPVRRALKRFQVTEGGNVGRVEPMPDLILALGDPGQTSPPNPALREHLSDIFHEGRQICMVAYRLQWFREAVKSGRASQSDWRFFTASDIALFFVAVRSLFDHTAAFIALLANKKGTVPPGSFGKLRSWLGGEKAETNRQRLGPDLTDLVSSCDWFDGVRDVRDAIVHNAAQVMVFPSDQEILFQVHSGSPTLIHGPAVMSPVSPAVVDFRAYAGLRYGYLIDFLDRMADVAWQRLRLQRFTVAPPGWCPGMEVLHQWMASLANRSTGPDCG